jgi:NAD(P)-dependent dehydrogenase (short-subunit alcohol dehydrogenase family)
MFSLAGKTALITGATGHLGRSIALALAGAGAHVLINARKEAAVASFVAELRGHGFSAAEAVFDITDSPAVADFFRSAECSKLHVLVNNAYGGGAGNFLSSDEASYRAAYDVTVVAAHNIVRGAIPHLKNAVLEHGEASVINMASMYGMVSPDLRVYDSAGAANPPFYGAAKAALLQWTRYLACELGPQGIRVNAVSPGAFPSEGFQHASPECARKLLEKVPLGRFGKPSELKGPVVFLASAASSYVNGANLVVDGGWTCW